MIPGTIEEWKAALASSKPGAERGVCVQALEALGAEIQSKKAGAWQDIVICQDVRYQESRARGMRRMRGGMLGLRFA